MFAKGNASGSASSNSVGMVSTKCVANMSSDQDCVITSQEDEPASQKKEQPAKKQKVLTSAVWEHFNRITSETKEGKKKIDAIYEIREFLSQLFNEYAENFGNKSGLVESSRLGGEGIVGSSVGGEWLGGFQDFVASNTRSSLNDESVETLMCVKDWLPDLKDGQSAKVVEDGMCDLSYSEWDLDF
ncbi:hypothetical protein POM88_010137 [Heracleum sosnowskyi]|uniref:Uncharacterized protein n=1 Tax=Heracleum sosnowskyi TaxID=360622 RepID=A0AAD8JB89_9APIA|nr:hypothetical protein POM88_010137 [Heracleum sosnowskyi]